MAVHGWLRPAAAAVAAIGQQKRQIKEWTFFVSLRLATSLFERADEHQIRVSIRSPYSFLRPNEALTEIRQDSEAESRARE
jgi:hypothetical protein